MLFTEVCFVDITNSETASKWPYFYFLVVSGSRLFNKFDSGGKSEASSLSVNFFLCPLYLRQNSRYYV